MSTTSDSTTKPIRKRSRGGCHNCKRLKIKCDEQKPTCKSCQKYNVVCDYSLKLSWGGRPSKRNSGAMMMVDMSSSSGSSTAAIKEEPISKRSRIEGEYQSTIIKTEYGTNDSIIYRGQLVNNHQPIQSTPISTVPTKLSLSNQEVQHKINNIESVFQPTPQQKPVSSGSFILEYNIPSERKIKREPIPEIVKSPSTFSNTSNSSSPNLTNGNGNGINTDATATTTDISRSSSTSNQNEFNLISSTPTFTNVPKTHVLVARHHEQPLSLNNQFNSSNDHRSHHNNSMFTLLDPSTPHSVSDYPSTPQLPPPDNIIDDDELALTPPRYIPELSALDSLNNLLEEDTFLQDQQFIDDFIISEHAFSNSFNKHQSYKNALLQVPARNIVNGSSSNASRALAAYHNHKRFVESLINGGKSIAESTTSTEESINTPSDTGTDDSERTSDIIVIPRGLTPLPDILIQVPVYRDLFYHFVDVTADALVPVPQLYSNNPFKIVLPRLALNTPHILSLIIAYAATHRSKVLHQPEPIEMISKLLERTFDGLTQSLENEKEALSDTTLATAVMLSSYSIISSAAEESWKTHLHGAREIVIARGIANSLSGGILSASSSSPPSYNPSSSTNSKTVFGPQPLRVLHEDVSNNEVLSFLIRVFAYIDVIGALSSSSASSVLTNNEQASQLWTIPNWNRTQQRHYFQDSFSSPNHSSSMPLGTLMNGDPDIDFLLGIDLNLIPVLSKVSSLAKRRRNLERNPHKFTISEANAEDADLLSEGLELSKVLISCCSSGELRRKERIKQGSNFINQREHNLLLQLSTMNLTFGYAGLIHLYRRVLKLTTDSAPVQELVTMITDLLDENIPIGTSIEACMSFPIFTTACEVINPEIREQYRARMNSMQRFGFGQVSRAQELMEECWARNEPWTGIMDDLGWGLVLA